MPTDQPRDGLLKPEDPAKKMAEIARLSKKYPHIIQKYANLTMAARDYQTRTALGAEMIAEIYAADRTAQASSSTNNSMAQVFRNIPDWLNRSNAIAWYEEGKVYQTHSDYVNGYNVIGWYQNGRIYRSHSDYVNGVNAAYYSEGKIYKNHRSWTSGYGADAYYEASKLYRSHTDWVNEQNAVAYYTGGGGGAAAAAIVLGIL